MSPVSDPSCEGYYISSNYGERHDPFTGEIKFHTGIDLAKWGGCKIVGVYKGDASSGWYAGNTVFIKHEGNYETRYGHAKYYTGIYPRKTRKGEEIMYMGQSGKATGVHLHFEVWENGHHVDPSKYFNFKK
ncbi:M23 family metallopeptidase [Candidatus Dojkabacteria bacterium]|nr:M23 family metallopeptidase [Candidatus Dojkabacteria bacterium]